MRSDRRRSPAQAASPGAVTPAVDPRGATRAAPDPAPTRGVLAAAAPLAFSVGVFGVVFGALATPRLGATLTVVATGVVFSGTVQFALVSLFAAGAGVPAIAATLVALNARNLVLGAVVRPHVRGSRSRRAVLAWFLVDESVGLALTAGRDAGSVLLRAGLLLGAAWLAGTVVGVAGGQAAGLTAVAEAVFPVLFIGLAAMAVRHRNDVVRAVAVAAATAVVARTAPGLAGFVLVAAAVAAAVPSTRSEAPR
jgi:predicted branched-subunit amino acid permease